MRPASGGIPAQNPRHSAEDRPVTRDLRHDEVYVWYAHTASLTPEQCAQAVAVLDPGERIRHDRFRFPEDRRDFAAAHALLRRALSFYADVAPEMWRFETDAHGKPRIASAAHSVPPLAFNISHTRGLVACAVALDADVGVDVEGVDRLGDHMAIADRYFSPSEIDSLRSCEEADQAVRFVELWTLKESHLKAIGVGLSHPLTAMTFDVTTQNLRFRLPDNVDAGHWQFGLFGIGSRHRLAVALRGHATPHPRRIAIRCGVEQTTEDTLGPHAIFS